MSDNRYDVVIIGTGAGGGTLAYHLAPSGKRILILERGDYVTREKANWDPQVVNVDAHYNAKESWLDKDGKDLHPHTNYYVGGNTKFYGAALFRLRKEDFGELRHHGGISPAWPISYDDLEPYYMQAENLYQVHGNRGEDPTEPAASSPYPWPAVTHEPRIQQLSDDFARSGLKPFHVPVAVMLDEKNPHKSRCIRCNTCWKVTAWRSSMPGASRRTAARSASTRRARGATPSGRRWRRCSGRRRRRGRSKNS